MLTNRENQATSARRKHFKKKDHQLEAIEFLLKHIRNGSNCILNHYTGAGKSYIMAQVCAELIKENPEIKIGLSAAFRTHLRIQHLAKFSESGLKNVITSVGCGQATDTSKNVFIFNPQAINSIKELPFKFDLLLLDEAHLGLSKNAVLLRSILKECCKRKAVVVASTATSWELEATDGYFHGCPVLRRGLHQGIEDGMVASNLRLSFHQTTLKLDLNLGENAYDTQGELRAAVGKKNKAKLKKLCRTKMERLLTSHDAQLGPKVLVIVPPGDDCVLAKQVSTFLSGKSKDNQEQSAWLTGKHSKAEEESILRSFQLDPRQRFLVVVGKCGVGFDMPGLTSLVDMTLSRNTKVLVQRLGRVGRRNKNDVEKYFFYLFEGLSDLKAELILNRLVVFSKANYPADKDKNLNDVKIRLSGERVFKTDEETVFDFSHLAEFVEQTTLMSKSYNDLSREGEWSSKTFAEMIAFVKKSKFKTVGQWKAESSGSYNAANKKGWLKAIYEACGIAIQPDWESMTLAEMIAFVKKSKFKTRGQWVAESVGSYQVARKKGWLKAIYEACGIAIQSDWKSMTLAEMIAFVKKSKFKTRGQWVAESGSSYQVAMKKGWLRDICKACGIAIKSDWKSMTLAEMIAFVKKSKFKTRGQWVAESSGSYAVAMKKGWLRDICKACGIAIRSDWKSKTFDEIVAFVKKSKFKTHGQWKAESGSSYAVAMKKGWLRDIYKACGIAIQSDWKSMTLAEMIAFVKKSKFKTRGQWVAESGSSYQVAMKKGWLRDIYKACGIAIKSDWKSMTLAEMIAFVKKSKFKTPGQWVAESSGSYRVAMKKGWLKDIYKACGIKLQGKE